MSTIDKSRPVLVTGATGYVAGWLIKKLLDEGMLVSAAVRDPGNSEKLKYLDALAKDSPGSIEYFKSDLLEPGSYAEAMKDCEIVFHTASPFTMSVNDPQKDLVDPARLGTRHVLHQANQTPSVKRVVVTSSCAAIYGDNADLANTPDGKFTEEIWNESSSPQHQPYSYSKRVAEQEAWKIADAQDRWKLVVVNPSLVLGPGINPFASSESFNLIKQLGDGTMKMGVPDYGIGVVDVRDLAEAHWKAATLPGAQGRNIISAHNTSFPELAGILRKRYGSTFPFPKRTLPKWLVWLLGPVLDKSLTRKVISRNAGLPFVADSSKSIRELGMDYRMLEASICDMFQQMIDHQIVK